MTTFHHRSLPSFSTLLAGPQPRDKFGFLSKNFQINYFNTQEGWRDLQPHAHQNGDEIFIVLQGKIIVEVEGERVEIVQGEFCAFPSGTFHQVIETHPPLECLIIRAPTGYDKVYLSPDGEVLANKNYHQDILGMLTEVNESTTF